MASAASFLGASLVLLAGGAKGAADIARSLQPFLADAGRTELSGGALERVAVAAAMAAAPVGWAMAAAAAAAVAAHFLQQGGIIFSPGRLAPDPSRLSPLKGFQRLYGPDGLAHFVRAVVKIAAIATIAVFALRPAASAVVDLPWLSPEAILPSAVGFVRPLLYAVLVFMVVIAGADFAWQRMRFMQRMKMTREEVREDAKETEGDPHLRARLRQIRFKRSRARMIQAVPKATVVVTNPTHYAVALRYVQGETAAPVCVAKGVDDLALRIRAAARDHEVPVVEDPPLARALYAAMDVDEAIPREHYEAVAKVIGFVLSRASRRARPPRPSAR